MKTPQKKAIARDTDVLKLWVGNTQESKRVKHEGGSKWQGGQGGGGYGKDLEIIKMRSGRKLEINQKNHVRTLQSREHRKK